MPESCSEVMCSVPGKDFPQIDQDLLPLIDYLYGSDGTDYHTEISADTRQRVHQASNRPGEK